MAPRFTEISGLPRDLGLVSQPFFVVLNSCTPDDDAVEDTREMLEDNGIPVSPVHITRLEAFTEALNYGQGVTEYQKDGQASEQVKALLGWIREV